MARYTRAGCTVASMAAGAKGRGGGSGAASTAETAILKVGVDRIGIHPRNPNTIRYSQSSIGRTFKDGNTLRETINGLKSGTISPESFPPIRIFERGGETFTLDNRRLFVFQQAKIPILTVPATASEVAAQAWKFTTKNNGTSITVRGGL